MNLSGKAVNYWLQSENVSPEKMLVIVDDLALPFGSIRIKTGGSDGGHNGLLNISEILGHANFARMRFGIGNNFSAGKQVDYVLGQWNTDELLFLPERLSKMTDAVKCYGTLGIQRCMNLFNQSFNLEEMIVKQKDQAANPENPSFQKPLL